MKATMDGATFNRLIGAVRAFVSRSESRPTHTLIQLHFSAEDTRVTAYALDGYRAAKECAVCYTVDEDFTALVAAPPLKANGQTVVEIERDGDCAYISYGDIRFRTKQPDGEVFDVGKFISEAMAKDGIHRFGANVDYLLDALKSIKAASAIGKRPVILEFRGSNDPLILRTDKDNPKMVLPVRLRSEELG